jgi:hypothetical protein
VADGRVAPLRSGALNTSNSRAAGRGGVKHSERFFPRLARRVVSQRRRRGARLLSRAGGRPARAGRPLGAQRSSLVSRLTKTQPSAQTLSVRATRPYQARAATHPAACFDHVAQRCCGAHTRVRNAGEEALDQRRRFSELRLQRQKLFRVRATEAAATRRHRGPRSARQHAGEREKCFAALASGGSPLTFGTLLPRCRRSARPGRLLAPRGAAASRRRRRRPCRHHRARRACCQAPTHASLACADPLAAHPPYQASRCRVAGAARASADATVLAADIGGTNARYQLWRVPSAGGTPVLSFEKARGARASRIPSAMRPAWALGGRSAVGGEALTVRCPPHAARQTYPTALHATFEASLDNMLKARPSRDAQQQRTLHCSRLTHALWLSLSFDARRRLAVRRRPRRASQPPAPWPTTAARSPTCRGLSTPRLRISSCARRRCAW